MAFVPLFSNAYANRSVTYMNEELALAVEQLHRMSAAGWLIPVTLDGRMPPDIEIGLHGRLNDL